MQFFKMDEVVGVRNDALIALLNDPAVTEHEDTIKTAKSGQKIGESEEVCFGLLTDIYDIEGVCEAEVGYLDAFDANGDEVYSLEVWYLPGDETGLESDSEE